MGANTAQPRVVTPHYSDATLTVHHGDCLDVLRELPDASVDAVVTDPPYELGFMGKGWDATGIAYSADLWREALRVLKPGGHLLAFGGTRTWHRLAVAVEDAGFEVRDSIAWLYGQGFPKSLNVTRNDPRFCQCDTGQWSYGSGGPTTEHDVQDVSVVDVSPPGRSGGRAGSLLLPSLPESGASADGTMPATRGAGGSERLMEGRGDVQATEGQLHRPEVRPLPAGAAGDGALGRLHHGASPRDGEVGGTDPAVLGGREPHQPRPAGQSQGEPRALPVERGPQARGGWPVCERCSQPVVSGLGTALKPSFEPVVVGRKPLVGTVAANVLAHGTGALNIDASRIGAEGGRRDPGIDSRAPESVSAYGHGLNGRSSELVPGLGRWPANVVLDEDQADALDQQTGTLTSGSRRPGTYAGLGYMGSESADFPSIEGSEGGASRFFYTSKASSEERVRVDGIAHPTVKPLSIMRWLVRLVTPPGGTVLEPFAGSGTTVEACILEGFKCIAIEREADYLPLIVQRINRRRDPVVAVKAAGDDAGLFDLLGEASA